MRNGRRALLVAAATLLSSAARAQEPSYRLTDLALLRSNTYVGQVSSYDRQGGNIDLGFDYGPDARGDRILYEKQGAGCVNRIWFATLTTLDETLRIYFDGQREPAIVGSFAEVFAGDKPTLPAPLVGNPESSSGGYYSYVPLCHQRSIRITLSPGYLPRYFHVGYETRVDQPVNTWRSDLRWQGWIEAWSAKAAQAASTEPVAQRAAFELQPRSTHLLFEAHGPGLVSAVHVSVPGVTPIRNDDGTTSPSAQSVALLRDLWLVARWDDEKQPSVEAPLGPLFALGDLGPGPAGGLPAGIAQDGTLYLRFPMPYGSHARITLENRGSKAVSGLRSEVVREELPWPIERAGRFATVYRTIEARPGRDMRLADEVGSGHMVGVVLSEQGDSERRQYLEGDERIFVDGLRTPILHGTGTEDLFNAAWYFNRGVFAAPSHGARAHVLPNERAGVEGDGTAQYRFFLSDPVPYRGALRFSIEHGPVNNEFVRGSTLVYLYRGPKPLLVQSDVLRVGDRESEQAHGYSLQAGSWHGSRTYRFEGRDDGLRVRATGRAHRGRSRFRLRVDPRNQGVHLRRLFDQGFAQQGAEVWVDGQRVGEWLTREHNVCDRFREEDFVLPAAFTRGKTQLDIELRALPNQRDWYEFEYRALSLVP